MRKKILFISALAVCIGWWIKDPVTHFFQQRSALAIYPYFHDHPHLTDKQRTLIAEHLLPLTHPLKTALDALFSHSRVVANEHSLQQAGFSIIAAMPGSFVIVARHRDIPGYVMKLYLDTETRTKEGIPNCEWLIRRCIGAKIIRNLIAKQKIQHFAIPQKWIYLLPPHPPSTGPIPQPLLVIETDMELVDEPASINAWKTAITPAHLQELYSIIKHGYGSIRVAENIPYTQQGSFAFTDTEYPHRKLKMRKVLPYLSEEMQQYWTELTK